METSRTSLTSLSPLYEDTGVLWSRGYLPRRVRTPPNLRLSSGPKNLVGVELFHRRYNDPYTKPEVDEGAQPPTSLVYSVLPTTYPSPLSRPKGPNTVRDVEIRRTWRESVKGCGGPRHPFLARLLSCLHKREVPDDALDGGRRH